MRRDERFGKLRTVFCIVLHIPILDLLCQMGSMRSKGKYDASVVRNGIVSKDSNTLRCSTAQLEHKVSRFTRLAMWC